MKKELVNCVIITALIIASILTVQSENLEKQSNDSAIPGYTDKYVLSSGQLGAYSYSISSAGAAGSWLNEQSTEKAVYDELKYKLGEIAAGKSATSKIILDTAIPGLRWTEAELGCPILSGSVISDNAMESVRKKFTQVLNLEKIIECLKADCPYELYWFDNVTQNGVGAGYNVKSDGTSVYIDGNIIITLMPSKDYAGTSGPYSIDTAKTSLASAVLSNAEVIVNENAGKSDRDKLEAYCNKICELVTYDSTASTANGYGNQWQMIYVFDNNPSTNVVCEGYSKAFQYLCDITTFKGDVTCYTVRGDMSGGTGAGRHMWNVVSLEGKNYLVDVTNCDTGSVGEGNLLFLVTSTTENGGRTHSFNIRGQQITYSYEDSQYDLFCNGFLPLSGSSTAPELIKIPYANVNITLPKIGKAPSFSATSENPAQYTGKVEEWYDETDSKKLSSSDTFRAGHIYEAHVLFTAMPGYTFDNNSVFKISSYETGSYGYGTQRNVRFELKGESQPQQDGNAVVVIGGKAFVLGKPIVKAKQGSPVILMAAPAPSGMIFDKWVIVSGDIFISNIHDDQNAYFIMPDGPVAVKATYKADHKLLKTDEQPSDCKKPGHKAYWYCTECKKYFADEKATSEIGNISALKAWIGEGGKGYIASKGHNYTQKIADEKYLATPATCTKKATYYYSCPCGLSEHNDKHTFESGELLPHDFSVMDHSDTEHWYKCKNCGAVDESSHQKHSGGRPTCMEQAVCDICKHPYGNIADHVFDKEVPDEKYLKSKANCTSKAVYYKSCKCGEKGEETFEYGEATAHTPGEWITDKEPGPGTEGKRHKECTVCKKVLETESIAALPSSGQLGGNKGGCGGLLHCSAIAVSGAGIVSALLVKKQKKKK